MPLLFAKKSPQSAPIANDGANRPTRQIRILLGQTTERLFWLAAGVMLCILFGIGITALWVIYHGDVSDSHTAATVNQALPVITVTSRPPSPVPSITTSAKTETAIPAPPGKTDIADGIALPAAALSDAAPDSHPSPDTVNFVAAQIGDRPVGGKTRNTEQNADNLITIDGDEPGDTASHLDDGQRALDNADYPAALSEFNSVLSADPDNRTARHGKALALQMLGQYDAAIATDRATLRRDPKDAFAWRHLKHLLTEMPDDARLTAEPPASTGPTDQMSDAALIRELSQPENPSPIDLQLNSAKDEPASDSTSTALRQATLARRALQRQDTATAIRDFDRAVRLAPDNLGYRLSLAIAYDRAGQRSAALGVYHQVLDILGDMEEPSSQQISFESIRARVDYLENSFMP